MNRKARRAQAARGGNAAGKGAGKPSGPAVAAEQSPSTAVLSAAASAPLPEPAAASRAPLPTDIADALRQRDFPRAVKALTRALDRTPDDARLCGLLARAYFHIDNKEQSFDWARKTLDLDPDDANGTLVYAHGLIARARFSEAKEVAERATELAGHLGEAWYLRAYASFAVGEYPVAGAILSKALEVDPTFRLTYSLMCETLLILGHLDAASYVVEQARERGFEFPELQKARANLRHFEGRADECVAEYRTALMAAPKDMSMWIGFVYRALASSMSPQDLSTIHHETGRLLQRSINPQPAVMPLPNRGDGKIRIGFVSGDFRTHSVAFFFTSLMSNLDRDRFEIYLYYTRDKEDSATEGFRSAATCFRRVHEINNDEFSDLARADQLDIAVDLAGYTDLTRIFAFAKQVAPIQVTWLGYPDTTGLPAMDYRITDEIVDPPGESDRLAQEEMIRLPGGFICYSRPNFMPDPKPIGDFTDDIIFGSFNAPHKVTPGRRRYLGADSGPRSQGAAVAEVLQGQRRLLPAPVRQTVCRPWMSIRRG